MSTNVTPLKQLFAAKHDFVPTTKMARDIARWRTLFETRGEHPEVLNTPLLAVNKMRFLPKDADALFDIIGISVSEFTETIEHSSINTDYIVASNPYNLAIVWAVHKFYNSNLPRNVREDTCVTLFFMLLVKFFSSVVGHLFPHGADKAIMEATIDSLSDKYDIKHKDTNTWKLLMLARAKELIQTNNIHFNTIKTFMDDTRVTYVLTDTQTRLRTKLVNVSLEYYRLHAEGKAIRDSELTDDDKESGDKRIKELVNNFDAMTTSVTNRALNVNQFVKNDYLKLSCKQTSNVKVEMLRELLYKFSTLATYQYQNHKSEEIDKQGNYKGYVILIKNLIQRTYRACIMDKVNLKSKIAILMKTSNLYRSSRISDPEILKIKSSVDAFVADSKISKRESTLASLKIAFIVYIILLTFDLD